MLPGCHFLKNSIVCEMMRMGMVTTLLMTTSHVMSHPFMRKVASTPNSLTSCPYIRYRTSPASLRREDPSVVDYGNKQLAYVGIKEGWSLKNIRDSSLNPRKSWAQFKQARHEILKSGPHEKPQKSIPHRTLAGKASGSLEAVATDDPHMIENSVSTLAAVAVGFVMVSAMHSPPKSHEQKKAKQNVEAKEKLKNAKTARQSGGYTFNHAGAMVLAIVTVVTPFAFV
mmetsp:Transcript_20178/g.40079  ORF Transcript_20178/g.40079 Transcript_20178/m.40079 type:complete len:227 (+) Transcript_20178:17-697(+)